MPRNQEADAPDLATIDSEIASTKASLDASIRSHSMRLAALLAQRQLALVGRYLAANPAAVLAEAAQDAAQANPGRNPPPAADVPDTGAAKTPLPVAAPKAARTSAGKAARPRAADKASAAKTLPEAAPEVAPSAPGPAPRSRRKPVGATAAPAGDSPASKPAKEPSPLVQAAREALRAAGKPMTALEIAKAIGVEPRKAAPYTAALLRTGFAVRSADGLFAAA